MSKLRFDKEEEMSLLDDLINGVRNVESNKEFLY
jgi:hypothetical protein